MGLLDELKDGALGGDAGGAATGQAGALDSIIDMVGNFEGGLPGLVGKFQGGGLGDLVGSWVGKGQNLPITAEQIQAVLGSGPVASLAAKLGIDPRQAATSLAAILPQVIDRMTPSGTVEPGASAVTDLLGSLKGKIDF